MIHSSEYSFALISVLFWALSAPVLNVGINRIYQHSNFLLCLFFGLLLALLSGSLSLGLGLFVSGSKFHAEYNGYVLGAGIFTFPVATGLYYITAHLLNNQTELASLFAKVKPLFSIFLAILIVDETLSFQSIVSVLLIISGLLLFGRSAVKGYLSWFGLLFGLLTAMAWSIGEIFVRIGFNPETAIEQTFYALSSASIISLLLWILFAVQSKVRLPSLSTFMPFLLHGIFSFGIAYMSFFQSIAVIGVIKSVIITAFWPMFSLILTGLVNYLTDKNTKIASNIWIAAFCFISASLTQLLNI
ncbi:EamA family transporter [Nitrosomonas supralitoralis]|uniref:EamA domain-containing protein n=1 Tax=Nitrosomonas supralitoralis TaxID=2116706 RepID=A0A2P7NRF4_9PROT|nr:EamA family transporter [Nitrosomonas supralitoralis]PSJ16066.1 hypothetical protein C7H79_15580 [Nitrosomonas supralitoralis]